MKKRFLILAAVAVSGVAAVVAGNTNAFVGDAEASDCEIQYHGIKVFECKGWGHCTVSGDLGDDTYTLVCWARRAK